MQNAVRGRAVLMLPTWYPGPSDPVAGVFVRDQALAIAAHHDVTVLVLEAADPPPGRRTDVAIADGGRAAHGARPGRPRAAAEAVAVACAGPRRCERCRDRT